MKARNEPFHGIETNSAEDLTPGRYHVAQLSLACKKSVRLIENAPVARPREPVHYV